ncbi:hypothetical protein [Mucilaginibacter ginsenosidivorax]|uniref:Class I SAM-dependent methyltransferase n=1 Tax=Mucilaginibacter ginsenosidivorax TaxID=862126 RepID=A0A5B8VWJ5_9SPHI|nr:hypothetical protein [Mucilaginibacter ginsenosidivorax]QEC76074.1 hypothetical protein FSB76_08995 [Mucilaginibacter ginsenosidivorax]
MWNLRFVQDYLKHRFTANNRHGIHSPFVYKLIDDVIYDYTNQQVFHEPGFAPEKGEGRRAVKSKVAQLVYRLTKHFNPAVVVELGSNNQEASAYLQKAAAEAKFYFPQKESEFITLNKTPSGLLVFHGENLKEKTLPYFIQYLDKINPDTIMLFTGMYTAKSLKQAWSQIKLNPKVTLTINLFWIGLVFFKQDRKEQEHFKVRY